MEIMSIHFLTALGTIILMDILLVEIMRWLLLWLPINCLMS